MSLFTTEEKRRVNDYYPGIGNRPPGLGSTGLLGLIADRLASVENGYGASCIGVEDAGGNFTGTDLETVLTELYTAATTAGSDTFTDTANFFTVDTVGGAFAELGALRMRIVADPGTAAAIPVTSSADIGLVMGAGVETNTLPDPPAALLGAFLHLWVLTDGGGTRAITAASPVAGVTPVMTFGEATDTITLQAVRDGAAAYRWKLIENTGVALS